MLLSDAEVLAFLSRSSGEAYDLLDALWDRVIGVTIDAGNDYEGMGVEVSANVTERGTLTEPCVKHNPKII